jgi:hypothetical protein
LNDETFGDSTPLSDDWEKQHEELTRLHEQQRNRAKSSPNPKINTPTVRTPTRRPPPGLSLPEEETEIKQAEKPSIPEKPPQMAPKFPPSISPQPPGIEELDIEENEEDLDEQLSTAMTLSVLGEDDTDQLGLGNGFALQDIEGDDYVDSSDEDYENQIDPVQQFALPQHQPSSPLPFSPGVYPQPNKFLQPIPQVPAGSPLSVFFSTEHQPNMSNPLGNNFMSGNPIKGVISLDELEAGLSSGDTIEDTEETKDRNDTSSPPLTALQEHHLNFPLPGAKPPPKSKNQRFNSKQGFTQKYQPVSPRTPSPTSSPNAANSTPQKTPQKNPPAGRGTPQKFFVWKQDRERMSSREINSIIRFYSFQVHSEFPFTEDFYYQGYLRNQRNLTRLKTGTSQNQVFIKQRISHTTW